MNTMRSADAPAQDGGMLPAMPGIPSRIPVPLVQAARASPDLASPIHSAHGCGSGCSDGTPPCPGRRMKRIFVPSGDHTGAPSREVDGAT